MDISQSIDKLTAKAVVPLPACRQATAFDSNKKERHQQKKDTAEAPKKHPMNRQLKQLQLQL
jgi:hypothetical protein